MARSRATPVGSGDWRPESLLEEIEQALDHRAKLLKSPKRQRRLRIAARRLDAVLAAFRHRTPAPAARRLAASLKSIRSAAGAARDAGLAPELAAPRLERYADAAKAVEHVSARRLKVAIAALERLLTKPRRAALIALVELLVDAAGVAPGSPDAVLAPRRAVARDTARLRAALDTDLAQPDNLHRARRRFKEVRYALEVMAPLLPDSRAGVSLGRLRRRLAGIQRRLGGVGDLHVVQETLNAAAATARHDAAHELRSVVRRADADMAILARTLAAELRSPRTDTILSELARYLA